MTSVVCKVFETILRDKIYAELEERNFFPRHQYGFRKAMGCPEALINITNRWFNKLKSGECSSIFAVFTDISKCFDRVRAASLIDNVLNRQSAESHHV